MSVNPVYVVIDLGSSTIRGLAASKLPDGSVSPIAIAEEPAEDDIRHGAVYNIDRVSEKIARIVKELDERLEEENLRTTSLYVGISTPSLRSEEEVINAEISSEGEEITDKHLDYIQKKIDELHYDRRTIITLTKPYYEVNGSIEESPKSLIASELVAHVSAITVKERVYESIRVVVEDRLKLKLAGIFASPLAEASLSLSDTQKELGCVFVDVGGGTTSIVIYLGGVFRRLRVLPFGGKNITSDLMDMQLSEEDAEEIKLNYAGATTNADREKTFVINDIDGVSERTIRVLDVNRYASARMKEIIANVVATVNHSGVLNRMEGGYVMVGGGLSLARTEDLLRSEVRNFSNYTQLLQYADKDNALSYEKEYRSALALAWTAEENCTEALRYTIEGLTAKDPATPEVEERVSPQAVVPEEPQRGVNSRKKKSVRRENNGLFSIGNFRDFFNQFSSSEDELEAYDLDDQDREDDLDDL